MLECLLKTEQILIKELGLKMDWWRVTDVWRFWKSGSYLDMKLTINQNSMKKHFHGVIVICSSPYLFSFVCTERTYLVDIQKIETNLFLVIISQTLFIYLVIISNIKRIEFVQYLKWIIAINIKGLANI